MTQFFFYTLFIIFFVAVGWYYTPDNVRDNTVAFLGKLFQRDSGEVSVLVKEVITPASPQEKRETLLKELKKNIEVIKEQTAEPVKVAKSSVVTTETNQPQRPSTAALIGSSEKIIKELEEANDDAGTKEKIIERIIETILPQKSSPSECVPASK